MVKLIQGCCDRRVTKCCELPHSKVLECLIKVKFGYVFQREGAVNRTHWLDCRMSKWKLDGKCLDQRKIVKMNIMRAHKEARIRRNSRITNYNKNK
jgi:hypothetical protein